MIDLYDIWRGDVMPVSGLHVSIGRNHYDPPAPVVPVFDIHQRQAIFYDSGLSFNNSGVITFNAERNVLQIIPGNSGTQTITTAVCFETYDSIGGSGIINSDTTIAYDTVRVNTHPNIFSYSSTNGRNSLQINASGLYEFYYKVAVDNRVGTFQNIATWVERRAPGGLFAEIPGTRSVLWVRNNASTADDGSCSAMFLLDNIGVGNSFRVRGLLETTVAAGSEPRQIADYSNFIVKKLG